MCGSILWLFHSFFDAKKSLTRNSHQPMAAGSHLPESTALGSDEGLDVLLSMPARFVTHAPCISGHLCALVPRSGENCGLKLSEVLIE